MFRHYEGGYQIPNSSESARYEGGYLVPDHRPIQPVVLQDIAKKVVDDTVTETFISD